MEKYYCIICDTDVLEKSSMCSMCRENSIKDLNNRLDLIRNRMNYIPDLFLQKLRLELLFNSNIDITINM